MPRQFTLTPPLPLPASAMGGPLAVVGSSFLGSAMGRAHSLYAEISSTGATGSGRTSLLVPCGWSGLALRAWDNGPVNLSHLAGQRIGQSPFPPIADYGFLSDCEVTALVAPSGNVEWLCLPRLDSPSVFGAILDRHAGGFRVGPADVGVPAA